MAESIQEMQAAAKRLLDTREGGDLILVCKGKEWKVHSSYLWPRSSWFKAACRGGFSESKAQQIVFPEEEPSMIYRMLEYLYMQDYSVDLGFDPFLSANDSWAKTRLHVHAQMYSLGDKYDLAGLKKEAARRFINDIAIPRDKKGETLTLLSVIPTIYTTTPDSDRGLRDLVARHVFQRYDIASKHFIKEIDAAFGVPQFARDIIVLDGNRPPIDTAALTKKLHRHWHRCLQTLRRAARPFSNTAAGFHTRVRATGITLNGIGNLFAAVHGARIMLSFVWMLLALFVALLFICEAKLVEKELREQCALCEHRLFQEQILASWRDRLQTA